MMTLKSLKMFCRGALLVALILTTGVFQLNAQKENDQSKVERPKTRPTVGLVLSGGGAKGSAHIGVLKYLEEEGIPVDYITGTSMGAIIGGLYALGYSANQLDTLISEMDWSLYMSDRVAHRDLSIFQKEAKSKYLLSVPFNTFSSAESRLGGSRTERGERPERPEGSFIGSLPGGFISGNNLTNLFYSLCVGYQSNVDFNKLPIPYACVASDIIGAREVVLRHGDFPLAMRASMAIPGVFAPVKMDNMVLVDGGMFNNFPADVCKNVFGADIIIGVEVSGKMAEESSQLNSLPEMFSQLMGVVTQGKDSVNQALCDIYIHPDITGYSTMSFDKASIKSLIQRGYNSAVSHKDDIDLLKESLKKNRRKKMPFTVPVAKNLKKDSILITSFSLNGVTKEEGEWLMWKSKLLARGKTSGYINGKDIDNAISYFYGTNFFSSVDYRLSEYGDNYFLELNFKKAEPHRLGIGFRFDSEESAAILLSSSFNVHKISGVKFDISGRLSYNPRASFSASFAPNIPTREYEGQSPVVPPKFTLAYNFSKADMRFFVDGELPMSTRFFRHNVDAYFSQFYARNLDVGVGVRYDNFRFTNYASDQIQGGFRKNDYLLVFSSFTYNNQNQWYFADKGVNMKFDGQYCFSGPGTNFQPFATLYYKFNMAIPAGKRLTILPTFYYRSIFGDGTPMEYENMIGGLMEGRYLPQQIPFFGYNRPRYVPNNFVLGKLDFRAKIISNHYVSAIVNYAFGMDSFSEKNLNAFGAGLEYAYKSAVGPVSLDFFWSTFDKSVGLYFNLGYYF